MTQPNKVVLIVLAVLAAALLLLAVELGACNGFGEGGSVMNAGSVTNQSDTSEEIGVSNANNGTNGVQEESYDAIKADLESMLNSRRFPVGANVRAATEEEASIPTAQEAYKIADKRGFGNDYVLSVSFALDGTYLSESDVERDDTTKYPSYSGTYLSKENIVWMIVINSGKIFATPVGTKDGSITKGIVLSEIDTIIQYEGKTNEYSDFSLSDLATTGTVGVKVAKIDASTLDSYTLEDLSRM